MTSHHDKPKRWRPRFSVRTLVIVVTLVCLYAACWGPTKRRGVEDVLSHVKEVDAKLYPSHLGYFPGLTLNTSSPTAPLIVGIDYFQGQTVRRYYFWFFGYVVKLPYERPTTGSSDRRAEPFQGQKPFSGPRP
jgi:hypothetical protein